jgi:hypothetical protein
MAFATSRAAERPWHHPAVRCFLAAATIMLACAAGAHAHVGGSHTGFHSRVSVIEPFLPGLLIQVLGGHERLSVTNLTEKRVAIFDGRGRQLVRIDPDETEVWHEPRIGSTEEPPEEEGLVRNWQIRGSADGAPFVIRGFLGYRPPEGAAAETVDDDLPTWVLVVAGGAGAFVLAAALAVPLLRRGG